MSFLMIDRILGYEKERRIEALKVLSLSEEYLADHFSAFPIMPGVLMLEAMVQAAGWLMRLSGGSSHPVIMLKRASAVRYGQMVRPGDELRVEAELVAARGDEWEFKGRGSVRGRSAIVGRFVLARETLGRLAPGLEDAEAEMKRFFTARLRALQECPRTL